MECENMIAREKNPEYLNSFLNYSITILNKSPNSVKEYNYDIANFLKYIMIQFKMTGCQCHCQRQSRNEIRNIAYIHLTRALPDLLQ